jgi:tetratricopeptide (TPR) repeat protein
MTSPARLIFSVTLCATVFFAGCATTPTASSDEQFSELMMQTEIRVSESIENGNKDDAVRIVSELVAANPGRKEPWIRIAKIHFDATDYAEAIVAADEALEIDSSDRTAKSIRAVSGLRVAAQSLADLRNDAELKGNARADAAGLAMTMRDILGEDVLVPPAELEARKRREARAKREAALASRPPVVRSRPQPQAREAQTETATGNPFGNLR